MKGVRLLDKIFISISFGDETDWDQVMKVVDKIPNAHSFSFSKGVYYTGDAQTADILVAELSKLAFPMKVMRNLD